MLASYRGHHECVGLLLKAGAAKDTQDNDGWTALMHASNEGHHECFDLLLKAGAEKDAQNNYGWTALWCASFQGFHACVDLLLKAGAVKDTQDNDDGMTALMVASDEGHHGALTSSSKLVPGSTMDQNQGVVNTYTYTYTYTYTHTTHTHTHTPQVVTPSEQGIEQKRVLEARLGAKVLELRAKDSQVQQKGEELGESRRKLATANETNENLLREIDMLRREKEGTERQQRENADKLRREKEGELALLRAQLHDDDVVIQMRSDERLVRLVEGVMQEQMQRRVDVAMKLRLKEGITALHFHYLFLVQLVLAFLIPIFLIGLGNHGWEG